MNDQISRFISPQMSVAEFLTENPQTIPVFFRHRMICVGCDLARFETLAEAAQTYGLKWESFRGELEAALDANLPPQ